MSAQVNASQLDTYDVDVIAKPVEQAASIANQQTFNKLITAGCNEGQVSASNECGGANFTLFQIVRALEHTVNEINGNGKVDFSLGSNSAQLSAILRTTAGEEFAAQADLANDFTNGQLSDLTSRLSALRQGAAGFNVAINNQQTNFNPQTRLGGGASADDQADLANNVGDGFSQWGGFFNFSSGTGERDATALENAFDQDFLKVNGGIDYRIDQHWVVGTTLGYSTQDLTFDGNQSIVDGSIESTGYNVMPFVLYQDDALYWSVSLGLQKMDLDTDRAIIIPSLVNTRAKGNTSAQTFSVFTSVGYAFTFDALIVEPYLEFDYLDITIDGYTETDVTNSGLALAVNKQKITSKELTIGLNFQYIFTPEFGVLIPNLNVQFRRQLDDSSRNISSLYADNAFATDFNLSTDQLDQSYYVISLGLTSVIRGGAQQQFGEASSGGIQAFINYQFVAGLDNYSQNIISAGVRYEF